MSFFELMYCYCHTLDGRVVFVTGDELAWILDRDYESLVSDFPSPF